MELMIVSIYKEILWICILNDTDKDLKDRFCKYVYLNIQMYLFHLQVYNCNTKRRKSNQQHKEDDKIYNKRGEKEEKIEREGRSCDP